MCQSQFLVKYCSGYYSANAMYLLTEFSPFLLFLTLSVGLCDLTVERLLAIQKVVGSNLGRSASR